MTASPLTRLQDTRRARRTWDVWLGITTAGRMAAKIRREGAVRHGVVWVVRKDA